MKRNLTLIVHTDDEQDLINCLRASDAVHGFTLSHAEGHGRDPEPDAFLAARDRVVGASPRLRAELILAEEALEAVMADLRVLKEAGRLQQVHYWVSSVEKEGLL